MREGPGSTIVTYSPLASLQLKPNGPAVGGTVRLCTPHALEVSEL